MVMRTFGAFLAALVLCGCTQTAGDEGPGPAPPSETRPDPPTRRSVEDTLDLFGERTLPRTSPPRLAYVDGSVLRFPDGRTLELPRRWGTTSIVRYAGGYLVTDDRSIEGAMGMHRLDAGGRVLESWSTTGPALVADGRIAWVSLVPSEGGRIGPTLLHADSVGGGDHVTQRLDRSFMPILTGWFRGRLVYETWGRTPSFLTDLVHPPRAIPKAEDPGVVRPDGAYLVRRVRAGLEVLHHDGQVSGLIDLRGLGRTSSRDVAWEDDGHFLTTLVRDRRQAVVRFDMSGNASLATPWRRTDWTGFAFLAR